MLWEAEEAATYCWLCWGDGDDVCLQSPCCGCCCCWNLGVRDHELFVVMEAESGANQGNSMKEISPKATLDAREPLHCHTGRWSLHHCNEGSMMCDLDDDDGAGGVDDSIPLSPILSLTSLAANPHSKPRVQIPDCFQHSIPYDDIVVSCPPLSLPWAEVSVCCDCCRCCHSSIPSDTLLYSQPDPLLQLPFLQSSQHLVVVAVSLTCRCCCKPADPPAFSAHHHHHHSPCCCCCCVCGGGGSEYWNWSLVWLECSMG